MGFSTSIQPKPPTSTADWSQENLRLPRETGAFQSRFELDYGPHLYGIFAAFDDPNIEEIYCMKAAQVLWTTSLLAYIFHRMDMNPGVFLGMFASEGAAKKFSLSKLKPMGMETDPIAKMIDFSSRKEGNSILRKEFKGGFLEMMGSNAIWGVKSTTADFVFVEEPDDANENLGDQGDSIKLLFERTKRVRRPKKILGGTPSVKGFSRVEEYIARSDKRVLPIRCHDCGEYHVLDFENIVGWEATGQTGVAHDIYGYNKPENAVYACPECGSIWDDFTRKQNIRETVQIAMDNGDPLCGWVATRETKKIAGFTQLNELYSCLPGVGVEAMVADHLEAEFYASKGDTTKKIVFINSKLGKPYQFEDGRENAETLRELSRKDPLGQHKQNLCPSQGLVITVGVDVQDNRLAIVVRAWGRDYHSWLLYADEIYAQVATTDAKDPVWDELDKIVFSPFEHESGNSIYAKSISIDSGGHATDSVYNWVVTRNKKYPAVNVMAIKGSNAKNNPKVFAHPTSSKSLETKRPEKMTKAERKGVKLYIVGTQRAKDHIAEQMGLASKGQTRMHFMRDEDLRNDYFDHMLGEAKVPDKSGNFSWQKKSGCAVEFWDCEVYAQHSARGLGVFSKSDRDWDDIEHELIQSDLFADSAPLIPVSEEKEDDRETYTPNFASSRKQW